MKIARFALLAVLLAVACGGETVGHSRADEPGASGGAANPDGGGAANPDAGAGGVPTWADAATPVDTTEHSGTRIQVVEWMAGSVDLFRKELRDAKHDEPCELKVGADGVTRCLPLRGKEYVLFSDERCTQPAVFIERGVFPGGGCLAPASESAFVAFDSAGACPVPETSLFTRGSEVPLPTALYVQRDLSCQPIGALDVGPAFEAVPSPLSDWVPFRRDVVALTATLGVEMWTGQDGSVVRGKPYLLADEVTCELLVEDPWNGPTARCLPSNLLHQEGGTFADDACTALLITHRACDVSPRYVEISSTQSEPTDECSPWVSDVAELGEAVPQSSAHWMLQGSCAPTPAQWLDGLTVNRIGAAVPISRFPLLTSRVEKDGAPSRIFWTLDGKDIVPNADTASTGNIAEGLRGECFRDTLLDGTSVCATWRAHGGEGLFGDPKCQNPLEVMTPSPCGKTWKPEAVAEASGSELCAENSVRVLRGLHVGPIYQLGYPDTCTEIANPYPDDAIYDLGPKVPEADVSLRLEAKAL